MKRRRMPIVTVTAYDAPGGRLAEQSGVDIILVCDGQVLVYHDFRPARLGAALRQAVCRLNGEIADALSRYAADVRSGIGSEPAVSRP